LWRVDDKAQPVEVDITSEIAELPRPIFLNLGPAIPFHTCDPDFYDKPCGCCNQHFYGWRVDAHGQPVATDQECSNCFHGLCSECTGQAISPETGLPVPCTCAERDHADRDLED
jgi:hypothetical protein